MIEALVASQILLWVAVLAIAALVLALLRQVGQLHERIAPVGALTGSEQPAAGERAPVYELPDWAGRVRKVGGVHPDGRRTLLFFTSPTCPVCKELLPTVRSLCADEGIDRVIASDGAREEHERFVERHGLADEAYVLSAELGRTYQVAKLPHAVLLDADGVVAARGLVNTREHLESLIEAEARGVASVQEFLEKRTGDTAVPRRVA